MDAKMKKDLERLALQIRIGTLETIAARGFGHMGGSLSIADVLAVLYGSVMKYDPKNPKWEDRDKLVCSKGHAGPAVYATLAIEGFFPYDTLKTLNQPHTTLPSHCDKNKTPGIDMTTGSLGQGTSLAVGMAYGDKIKGRDCRTFVIVGDGEANEGQVWEAAMFTAAKKVTNLTFIIDNNKKQLDDDTAIILDTGDFRAKFEAFGFDAVRVDGSDVEAIYEVLSKKPTDKPVALILDTVKGAGIPEVINAAWNHHVPVAAEDAEKWLARFKAQLAEMA